MPQIVVDNLPRDWENMRGWLFSPFLFAKALREACLEANVPGLENRPDLISVTQGGMSLLDDDPTIIIRVTLLFHKAGRSESVVRHLAQMLGKTARAMLPSRISVEVVVGPLIGEDTAVWQSKP